MFQREGWHRCKAAVTLIKWGEQNSNRGMIITFLAPAVIIFLVVFLYPIIRTVMMSFYKIDAVTDKMADWTFTGLANYQKLLSTPIFATAMLNILKIWLIGGIIVLGLSLLFAVILTSGIRFKKFFRAVIYMPNIISAVALATMWQQYVYNSKFGLLTSVLKALHLDALAKTPWLDPDHLFWSMLFAYCFGMVGYHMLIWCSGIERISPDLFEAATIDGANKPKQFWYISRPLLKGVFKTNITMWSVSTAAFFVWSQLFSTVTASKSTMVPVQYMYLQTFGAGNAVTDRNAGYGAAIGIVLCICIVIIFTITNRVIKNDDLEF
jgi:multiple sugar transport system permease protein